ncbi:hypothetical protein ACP275_01G061200 [Erythranthe tilingii]
MKGLLKEQVTMGSAEAFPNLKELHILDCFSLKLPPLSASLKKLKKLGCSSLTLASLSEVDLNTLTELFVDFKENTTTCISIETLQSLTNLKKLEIYKACDELSIPEQGLRALISLAHLKIKDCDTLTCFPEGWLRHLTALEELEIFDCRELVELPEGIKHLHNLKKIGMYKLPKLVGVPNIKLCVMACLLFITVGRLYTDISLADFSILANYKICY